MSMGRQLLRSSGFASILATAAVLCFAGSALADGMARQRVIREPVVYERPWLWSGFYVGGHAGYLWSRADWDFVSSVPGRPDRGANVFDVDQAPAGFIGGGQLGYNWQYGSWVYGAELSGSFSSARDRDRNTNTLTAADDIWRTKIEDLFLATVRLGYAWDRSLLYLKGGYASAEIEVATTDTSGVTGFASSSKRHDGWTVGAGWEYKLAPTVSFGLEYNYIDLESRQHTQTFLPATGAGDLTVDNVEPQIHTIWARLNFQLK